MQTAGTCTYHIRGVGLEGAVRSCPRLDDLPPSYSRLDSLRHHPVLYFHKHAAWNNTKNESVFDLCVLIALDASPDLFPAGLSYHTTKFTNLHALVTDFSSVPTWSLTDILHADTIAGWEYDFCARYL